MKTSHSRLVFVARLALVAGAIYAVLPSKVAQLLVEESVSAEIAKSRSSSSFVLSGKGSTDFVIPPEQSLVKVVSNGNVPDSIYSVQDLLCEYTLRLEVLDAGGRPLKAEDAVLRSSPLNYRDDETSTVLPAQTYLGVPLLPLSSRTAVVNFEGFESTARRLRLSLVQADPRVKDVTVRVYANQKPAAYKLRYMWQRMPLEKRERLARANVHGLDFLTDVEKENLLENRWVAVAPLGIEGKEFFERKLYTLKERFNAILSGFILPRGVFVGPGTLGTLPVPEEGGCIRLDFQRVPGSAVPPSVHMVWYRRGGLKAVESDIELHEGAMSYSSEYDGGFLELESSDDVVVRAYLEGTANGVEITPEARCAQCYRVRVNSPVEFTIANGGGSQGEFRIDVRRVALEEGTPVGQELPLSFELLDEKRVVLGAGRIIHGEPDSWYDRMTGTYRAVPVSDPSRHYFSLPPHCVIFRVSSTVEGASVTAYTRPHGLVRQIKVPGDYLAYERAQDDARNWFPLRCENYTDCIANACEVFVKTQQRPPGTPEEELEAGWHTEACIPDGAVNGLKLLTPVEPDSAESREPSPVYFVKLDRGRTVDLYVGDPSGVPLVTPRLISLQRDDMSSLVSLVLDGRVHFQMAQASRSDEEVLPPIAEGWHGVRVAAPMGAEVYLNSLLVPPEAMFLERTVHRIGKDGLKYRVYKETPGREALSMRLYMPSALRAETVVRASMSGAAKLEGVPTDSWTFLESVYEIRAPEEGAVPAVGADEGPFSGGELFLLILGADLGPGWYDLVVRLDRGPTSYLSVLHIVPGTKEARRVSTEGGFITGDLEQ